MKKDFVSLAEARPDLAKEWNYEKNGDLKPEDVSCGSGKKVWWKLPYDVPDDYPVEHLRGKHFEFEWQSTINNRMKGRGCPFINNKSVWEGYNDLQTVNPELARQWHPTKNGDIEPKHVIAGSAKKVWWLYSYDDLNSEKHFDFEWQATIADRNNGIGCPFISNKAVYYGFNDLQTINPKLAAQWHPTKNGALKPTQISVGSNRKVWWFYSYDVPMDYPIKHLRGKHFDFEWQATIASRNSGLGCPFLSGQAIWEGFNDLKTVNPKLAAQWHPTKNGNLKPTQVTVNSPKKVWWLYSYNEPNTGKHFDFEWQAVIGSRKNNSCPFFSNHAVYEGFNDLQTINPELAAQWHPTKNGSLKPTQVTIGSIQKVWWMYPYDDPNTGKHFDFEWQATIASRNSGLGCPFLSGQEIWEGFNDLKTINPKLAAQWHPTKNGNLKPTQVSIGSNRKVWWIYSYNVPMDYPIKHLRGKNFNFEWKAAISNRNNEYDCPYLNGHAVWLGFNDLTTINPELAKQWHPTKNENLSYTQVAANSNKKVWWKLSYDVPNDYPIEHLRCKHFDFEWKASVHNRNKGQGCPYLIGKVAWKGFNDLYTVNPELAKQWHPTKNADLKPMQITAGSDKKVWWLLPYDDPNTGRHFDFEWQAKVYSRNKGAGCPYLTTYKGEEYIKQYLQKNNISFDVQQKFSDLLGTGNGQLSYDFSIPDEKYGYILIEYNGIQHYEDSEFFGGEEQLKKQKEHDKRKRDYAKKHGYKLITVKYTYDTYESVEEYLDKELKKLGVINDTKKEENVNDAA